ncbi:MAG: ECF transporter S component [Eggerthellales bacterium]|nr:ECF transporter S component [Eggerthellales bacterium]
MSEQSNSVQFQNTNKWSTKELVTMALFAAIATVLMFIQIPILPSAPFLTYDPSFAAAAVVGFAFGPAAGLIVGIVASVLHALFLGEWVGALMNIAACIFFILPAAAIYKKDHTLRGAVIGLIAGCIFATLGAFLTNATIGVWFWYGDINVILPLMIPAVLPFNLLKTILNSVIALAVYKTISNLITPKKDQVKGR